ncbi:MAG: hypothetical protein EBZ67_09625 [Chitinophagia bacterium]|nr:hypothetical protein [Chitinophagia bacterium]
MTISTRLRWAEVLPALVGIAFASATWFSDRGLWLDEAALGLNLLERGHAGLLRPLNDGQAAPLLYLQIAKLCAEVFGPSTLSMRLPSLLAFLLSVILFSGILRRSLETPAARIIAMSLLCFNLMLLRYSGELKQYMTEVLVCLWVTRLTLSFHKEGGTSTWPLLLAGLMGILLSNTAAMVMAMAGCMMLLQWQLDGNVRVLRSALACGLCWLGALTGYYLLYAKGHPSQAYMLQYWERAGGFGPADPFGEASLRYLSRKLLLMRNAKNIFHIPVRWANLSLLLVPLAVWLVGTERRNRWLLLLPLPLVLHLLLSYLRIYPFDIRMTLYLLPLTILAASYGLDRILLRCGLGGSLGAWMALTACLWQAEVFRRGHLPIRSEELRPVAQEVERRIRPGERLWLNPDARYAFRFYRATGAYGFAGNEVTEGIEPAPAAGEPYEAQVEALRSDTWILLTHLREADVRRLLTGLSQRGLVVTDSVKAHAAFAFRMAHP